MQEYVTRVEGEYRVGATRVSLDSLVYLYREGLSAEGMVKCYPALTLEQVHGALAFYLGNQKEVDAYLVEGQHAAQLQHRIETDQCGTDGEAAAGTQCKSDSRLMSIWTGAFCAACDA